MLINYLAMLQIFINCKAIYIYFPKTTIEDVCAVSGEVLFGGGRYPDSHIPGEDSEVHGNPWKIRNPLTLLVGMQTSTATMENSVEIP